MRTIGDSRILARHIGDEEVIMRSIGGEEIYLAHPKSGLYRQFDGTNNTGFGYDPSVTAWADLQGNAPATLINATFANNGVLFNGNVNAKVTFSGQNVREYTIINTFNLAARTGQHPRINAENPYPTMYLQSNQGYAIAFYGQGKDMAFSPAYIPPTNTAITAAMCWSGPGNPVELYVNGEYKGATTVINTYPGTVSTMYLGANSTATRTFTGTIHEHLVYGNARSADEIMFNANVSRSKFDF